MAVYLAADEPLHEVPWDEAAPSFYICSLQPDEERVRKQFRKPFVVYAGSHEGCGCGFQLGEYADSSSDQPELSLRQESLRRFAAYLRKEVIAVGSIELFACWEGDQEVPPEHQRSLTPSAVEDQRFFFLQKELSIVTPDAA